VLLHTVHIPFGAKNNKLKLIVFSIPRTGSHVISRSAEANGYKVIHEPFTFDDVYHNYDKFIKKVVLPSENVIVFDRFLHQSNYNLDYLNKCKRDYDLSIVLLRRDVLQQAISVAYARQEFGMASDWNLAVREKVNLKLYEVKRHFRNLTISKARLLELNLPTVYYEDILADPSIFPVKLTIEHYRPPEKSDYILNHKEIKLASASWIKDLDFSN
jgi:hypothetical protein